MTPTEVHDFLKPLTLKDLRIQLRTRNLQPAGGKEALQERLAENMLDTGDFALRKPQDGPAMPWATVNPAATPEADEPVDEPAANGNGSNNYARTEGQNVGNFMTERPTSRVLAPPGGESQIFFGDNGAEEPMKLSGRAHVPNGHQQNATSLTGFGGESKAVAGNNYHRPAGQNVGNFMTDRNSSRVLAPPGGASTISLR